MATIVAACALTGLGTTANAAHERAHVCIQSEALDYLEDTLRDSLEPGEDYGRIDDPIARRLPRMLTRVLTEDGEVLWGWRPTSASGCTDPFTIPASRKVVVETLDWAHWDDTGNDLVSYDCTTAEDSIVAASMTRGCHMPRGHTVVDIDRDGEILVTLDSSQTNRVFWAASQAEERHAYHYDRAFYVSSWAECESNECRDRHVNSTVSGFAFGGNPSSMFPGEGGNYKYKVAHEYGHQQTLLAATPALTSADLDYCYSRSVCQHSFDSLEHQPAAAVEGFAQFYAMASWNDFDGPGVLVRADGSARWSDEIPMSLVHAKQDRPPAGIAIERDWAFALWDFATHATTIERADELVSLMGLGLAGAYPWQPTGLAFWGQFQSGLDDLLGNESADRFRGIAAKRGIDG
jgi:hypothetical protein